MKKAGYIAVLLLIAANVEAASLRSGRKVTPNCGIRVSSYKFVGNAGTEITYARKRFTIPRSGVAERIAEKNSTTFEVAGAILPIPGQLKTDEFGTATLEVTF